MAAAVRHGQGQVLPDDRGLPDGEEAERIGLVSRGRVPRERGAGRGARPSLTASRWAPAGGPLDEALAEPPPTHPQAPAFEALGGLRDAQLPRAPTCREGARRDRRAPPAPLRRLRRPQRGAAPVPRTGARRAQPRPRRLGPHARRRSRAGAPRRARSRPRRRRVPGDPADGRGVRARVRARRPARSRDREGARGPVAGAHPVRARRLTARRYSKLIRLLARQRLGRRLLPPPRSGISHSSSSSSPGAGTGSAPLAASPAAPSAAAPGGSASTSAACAAGGSCAGASSRARPACRARPSLRREVWRRERRRASASAAVAASSSGIAVRRLLVEHRSPPAARPSKPGGRGSSGNTGSSASCCSRATSSGSAPRRRFGFQMLADGVVEQSHAHANDTLPQAGTLRVIASRPEELNWPDPRADRGEGQGAIAQLGERLDRTQEVAGSSPASSISAKAP